AGCIDADVGHRGDLRDTAEHLVPEIVGEADDLWTQGVLEPPNLRVKSWRQDLVEIVVGPTLRITTSLDDDCLAVGRRWLVRPGSGGRDRGRKSKRKQDRHNA